MLTPITPDLVLEYEFLVLPKENVRSVFAECKKDFLSFMSVLRMLTMARLYKCKSTTLLHFRFISNRICVLKIPNFNFLFSQLQIAVILLFPLNTEIIL